MISQQNTSNKVIQELQNQVGEKIIASFDMVAQDRSNYFAKNPYQHQRPSTESANSIVNGYAKCNGGISAAANLVPAGPLGILAVAPEIITVMRNQIAMIYDVGVAYDKQQYLNKELLASVLISSLGTAANRVIVIKASEIIARKLTPSMFKRIVHQLTATVVNSAAKSSVSKWLPGVGPTAMGLWSAYSTKQVGNKAIQIFEKEIEILDETQSLSESSIEYTDNLFPTADNFTYRYIPLNFPVYLLNTNLKH